MVTSRGRCPFRSVVLASGLGYEWPSRVGAGLAVLGVLIAVASGVAERRSLVGAVRAEEARAAALADLGG